jgi:Leucine-rich repeat (LRR) protein
MELVGILSKVVKESLTTKKILLEYPESTVKRLLDKFSGSTDDTEEEIRKVIADFERFKGGFATDEKNELKQLNDQLKTLEPSSQEYKDLQTRIRDLNKTIQDTLDIFKYEYESLKNLTAEKDTKQKTKKTLESLVQDYVQKYKGTDLQMTKTNIKKFFEVKTHLPEAREFKKEVTSFNPAQLNELVGKYFSTFNNQGVNEYVIAIAQKFHEEKPDEDVMTTLLPRAKRFARHFELIPLNAKLSKYMTFEEFEHVVDGYTPMEESDYDIPEIDTSDVDIPYEDDNVLIFAPDEKQKCINIRKKHAPDRRWCTSWEGSGNYYYNYRLNQNLTLYYIINKNLPSSDTNYASVILVDRYGEMRLADGTNSGRYSGSQVIPWSEILSKIPVLKGKEQYLEAKPFSNEDMDTMQRYKQLNLRTTDPVAELGGEKEVEMWLELRSPDLSSTQNGDEIFRNLPEESQRKYIGLGNDLTPKMIKNLSDDATNPNNPGMAKAQSILTYYAGKKRDKLLQKSLKELTDKDIALIISDEMKQFLPRLKERYIPELGSDIDPSYTLIEYPTSVTGKFIRIFGPDELFDFLPEDIGFLQIENKSSEDWVIKIPESFDRFSQLTTLVFENCVKELPESIGNLTGLHFLNLTNNKHMTKLPKSIVNLRCLDFMSVLGTPIKFEKLPEEFRKYWNYDAEGFWEPNYPDEMKEHC